MRYLVFSDEEREQYPVCLLTTVIQKQALKEAYLDPHPELDPDHVVVFDLHQGPGKKTPMAEMKAYFNEMLAPVLTELGVQHIIVADGEYFKALTKATKVEAHLGYIMDCVHGPWKVAYVPNHGAIFYDPDKTKAKITQGITAILKDRLGNYEAPGTSIIKFAAYPMSPEDIESWLEALVVQDVPLTCDIETFSLKHHTAGIGTVSLAWNEHEGIAFPVDFTSDPPRVRRALRSFFERFPGKLIFHGVSFDVYVLIYQLWMDNILDREGLLQGIKLMLNRFDKWDCTKLITYLATNSCAGNKLGLKPNSQEFAGNYAMEEIKDITKIPLPELLEYNLVDSLATWYVFKKHHPTMIADQQEDIYRNLFKPAMVDIIDMQLTGMPLNMKRVGEVKLILQTDEQSALDRINQSPLMQQFVYELNEKHVIKRNAELVKKRIALGDEPQEFNPNSGPQLIDLLYRFLGLPVLALSDSKQPSTKGKWIKALQHHTKDPDVLALLNAFVDYKAVNKILTSFIPAMENAALGPDGWHYLFGNFNLGGTVSGRLSSSDPNLQNLPATGSRYAKLIKSCFEAPPGWLFAGLDFASLEDKISGLTSKDPAKLKVYTDGYDGHSLRAFAYFREAMPDIRQSEGRRAFKVTQDGEEHLLLEGDLVTLPDGQVKPIEHVMEQMGGN